MEFHQILVTARPGDAISNSVFELRSLLRRVGRSDIYARYIHPDLAGEVLPLEAYGRRKSPSRGSHDDILLFHASIGEPAVFSFVNDRPERLVVLYHNISPSAPFLPYDPAFAGLLDGGRSELAALRRKAVLALADSEFNARELRALGYSDVRVTPLIIDVMRTRDLEPDPDWVSWLDQMPGDVFLFVGQLLPHKRPDLLLQAFHILSTYLLPEAQLMIVGHSQFPRFTEALKTFVKELNLRAAVWGSVKDEQYAAFFRRANTFVTASEHEGFCVPLLEAWTFDIPVVARANGAIPETLGKAGILIPGDSDAGLLAEAMAEAMTNQPLRSQLIDAGRERLSHFDRDLARRTVLSHLTSIA